jgi:hypothetical protein
MPAATADSTIFLFFHNDSSYAHFLKFGPDGRPIRPKHHRRERENKVWRDKNPGVMVPAPHGVSLVPAVSLPAQVVACALGRIQIGNDSNLMNKIYSDKYFLSTQTRKGVRPEG